MGERDNFNDMSDSDAARRIRRLDILVSVLYQAFPTLSPTELAQELRTRLGEPVSVDAVHTVVTRIKRARNYGKKTKKSAA